MPPQNVVYFLMLSFLVHKIFTFYVNGVLNCKCPAPEPKGLSLRIHPTQHPFHSTCHASTLELRLSGLNGIAKHPDIQKFQTTGFFFENRLHWQIEWK
jgi:hypothetical protein